MKIDIAESLIRSWLRHIRECVVVETNWKAPSWCSGSTRDNPVWEEWFNAFQSGEILGETDATDRIGFVQFISKAEIDALGLHVNTSGEISAIAVDVAFHRQGLGYGGKDENKHRLANKMLRSAIIMDKYFHGVSTEIIFATPKTRSNESEELKSAVAKVQEYLRSHGVSNITLRCIFNEDFESEILTPTVRKADSVADTSELFLRAVSLLELQKISRTNSNGQCLPIEMEVTEFHSGISGPDKSAQVAANMTEARPANDRYNLSLSFKPDLGVVRRALIGRKTVTIRWLYTDGTHADVNWVPDRFGSNSNLIGNVRSRPEWRKGLHNGRPITGATVFTH